MPAAAGQRSESCVCRGALCRRSEKRRRLGRIVSRTGCRGGFTRRLHDGTGGKVVRGHGCRRGRGGRCGLCTCRANPAAHEFFGGPGAVAHHVVEAQRKEALFALVKRVFRMPGARSGASAAVAWCVARPHLVPSFRNIRIHRLYGTCLAADSRIRAFQNSRPKGEGCRHADYLSPAAAFASLR